jgi:hypothetical protein
MCQQDWYWYSICWGNDSSHYQVGRGRSPAQFSKKSAPLGVINGILTSVDYEVSNIACAAFTQFVDFHTKPASLWWYVLNPTQLSFLGEEGLINTDVLLWGVYGGNLDFRWPRTGWIL